jgi:hypothetical protein
MESKREVAVMAVFVEALVGSGASSNDSKKLGLGYKIILFCNKEKT